MELIRAIAVETIPKVGRSVLTKDQEYCLEITRTGFKVMLDTGNSINLWGAPETTNLFTILKED